VCFVTETLSPKLHGMMVPTLGKSANRGTPHLVGDCTAIGEDVAP